MRHIDFTSNQKFYKKPHVNFLRKKHFLTENLEEVYVKTNKNINLNPNNIDLLDNLISLEDHVRSTKNKKYKCILNQLKHKKKHDTKLSKYFRQSNEMSIEEYYFLLDGSINICDRCGKKVETYIYSDKENGYKHDLCNFCREEIFFTEKTAILDNRANVNLLEIIRNFKRDSRTYYILKMRKLGLDSEINKLKLPKED